MIIILYILAAISLMVGTAAIYMALIKSFPVSWLYYHYFIRKPVVWLILICSIFWELWYVISSGHLRWETIIPLALMILAVILTYRMHQETAFPAAYFPAMSDDPINLPLEDNDQLAIIDLDGITKAYPLDYVVHHHIVNDTFGDHIVALTYCAMCRSIIPFDVTDIGPLFVGSFKNANMIVADKKTKTFFQQATFESIIGPLHPYTLNMIPFQILPWSKVKSMEELPEICQVSKRDLREFKLPIPGIWKKIIASDMTPGLPSKMRDKTFPARTHIIGVIDKNIESKVTYLKSELIEEGIVKNEKIDVFFVASCGTVNAFRGSISGRDIDLTFNDKGELIDSMSGTIWNCGGKYKSGVIQENLRPIAISDEYWFSWKLFHPHSTLVRL